MSCFSCVRNYSLLYEMLTGEKLDDGNGKEEYTMDKKFEYIARTLSRTKRKEYENYVVNAIWNRLNTTEVKPVSQQYIKHANGYYLIDLYFPQLNIGIECDEEHHKRKVEQDISREITIFDILKQVKNISEYQALHVDVTRSYAEIEEEINFHVHTIHSCIESQKRNGCFTAWRDVSPYEYFAEKDTISIDSDIGFRTISETCNTLFATEYKGNVQQSWFIPSTFRKKYGQQYTVWFPKLAVENKAVVGNWHNELSPDGRRIIEFNESSQWTAENERTDLNESRVPFAHVLDPITRRNEYRFVGVFKYTGIENSKNIYTRINESFRLVKL